MFIVLFICTFRMLLLVCIIFAGLEYRNDEIKLISSPSSSLFVFPCLKNIYCMPIIQRQQLIRFIENGDYQNFVSA